MLYHNKPLNSEEVSRYTDDIVATVKALEEKVYDLENELEETKRQATEAEVRAKDVGYEEGYNVGFLDAEKKYKPKFVYR